MTSYFYIRLSVFLNNKKVNVSPVTFKTCYELYSLLIQEESIVNLSNR